MLTDDELRGAVLRIDRFGNLVTNIDRKTFEKFAKSAGVQVAAGGATVGRLVATYADIQPGEICALFGSTDHLELAANAGSAADSSGSTRGAVDPDHARPGTATCGRYFLRSRISRVLLFSRNDSATVSPSNILMMSRF